MLLNQCTMCTALNEKTRKSCKHCRCRKYLKPCKEPFWVSDTYHQIYYFRDGTPRDNGHFQRFPYELEYHSRFGWIIYYNEEFTTFQNIELNKNQINEAKAWAMETILKELGD